MITSSLIIVVCQQSAELSQQLKHSRPSRRSNAFMRRVVFPIFSLHLEPARDTRTTEYQCVGYHFLRAVTVFRRLLKYSTSLGIALTYVSSFRRIVSARVSVPMSVPRWSIRSIRVQDARSGSEDRGRSMSQHEQRYVTYI